jgi:hypothetical protein
METFFWQLERLRALTCILSSELDLDALAAAAVGDQS